jgi:hypothetical protein
MWGSGVVFPRILDLGSVWSWVASFTPLLLLPWGKSSRYKLKKGLGESQIRSLCLAEETNLPCRWSTIYLSPSACSASSQFTDRAVPVPVGCRINMKEGQFVNLIRKKRCAGYGVYRLVSGALKPREFPSFLLCLIFFEWLWLHFRMWWRVLWVVGTNLLPPPSGYTLFLAFQFIGFIVSASSHPRHRSNVLMSYQGSDNSRRRPARFATVFTSGIKKHGVG